MFCVAVCGGIHNLYSYSLCIGDAVETFNWSKGKNLLHSSPWLHMELSARVLAYIWETISTPDRIMNVWAWEFWFPQKVNVFMNGRNTKIIQNLLESIFPNLYVQ